MKKTTKAQKNMDIIAMLKGEKATHGTTIEEAIKHLEHENELLSKKSGSDRKPTKTQQENEFYKGLIVEHLSTEDKPKTVTEIQKAIPELADFSNQKISALVKQLYDAETIKKKIEKGRSYFFVD